MHTGCRSALERQYRLEPAARRVEHSVDHSVTTTMCDCKGTSPVVGTMETPSSPPLDSNKNAAWFFGKIRRPFLEKLKRKDKECRGKWLCCGNREVTTPQHYTKAIVVTDKQDVGLTEDDSPCRQKRSDRPRWRGLIALLLACIFSLCGSCIMWSTDAFHDFVANQMILDESKGTFAWWVTPPVNPWFRVYIWNYTNWDEYVRDPTIKIKLQEIGPFTYKEIIQREDIKFDDKGVTLSYKEVKSYQYAPERSGADPNATVLVPNLSFFGAKGKYSQSSLLWGPISLVLKTLQMDKPLVPVKAHDFIWGYDDNLFRLSKMVPTENMPMDQVGLLTSKFYPDTMTILTGASDIDKLSYFVRYNGKKSLNAWPSPSCNSFEGSDGSLFPPRKIRAKSNVYAFKPEACRLIEFVYEKDSFAQGVRAHRYILNRNTFFSPRSNPDNLCYCNQTDLDECPLDGLFGTSPCSYGAPTYISYPHFHHTDPKAREPFEGMNPDPEEHDMWANIHPRLGMTLNGQSRLQVNVRVMRELGPHLRKGFVLPVAWFAQDLPSYEAGFKTIIIVASLALDVLEFVLLYILPVVAVLTASVIVRRLLVLRRPARVDGGELGVD